LQIVINSLPNVNAITNSTAICAGNTATLTANGALTYTWNPGGTGSVIAVSPTQSTNYTVTGTDANTCINETTLALAVNQLPIITAFASTTLICAGQSLSLWAAGASAYTWNPGATSISTIVVSPLTPITYSVEGADNNNCKNFATIGIVVNPSPIIFVASSDSSICAGENVILSAGGAVTYTWNSAVSGQSISVSPVVSTTYTVAGTDVNSCLGSAIFLQQVSTCSGYTSEFLQEKMLIFPNPTSGKLYLQNLTDTDDLQIFNSIGQRVLQPMEIKVSLGVIEVDLTHQANGIYFLKTETGVWKIIKQ
ncbi:MAG: T9SS type A sorting domain-containing protein, partial [Bacteroidia bacterium]|nr:T9SS type A sorting domain-containing protein [Bacteroidia bacterium]